MGKIIKNYRDRYEQIGVADLLVRYPELRITPTTGDDLCFEGTIDINVEGPDGTAIADRYEIRIVVPAAFPVDEPRVWETAKRIPRSYHKLDRNKLCLGSPLQIRMSIAKSPSLKNFVDAFVVPYLFGHSFYERHGRMPFGELRHGGDGILDHLRELFRARDACDPSQFLFLASRHKRSANKLPCPCNSGERLGRCHNRVVNAMRREFGRTWFAAEFKRIKKFLE